MASPSSKSQPIQIRVWHWIRLAFSSRWPWLTDIAGRCEKSDTCRRLIAFCKRFLVAKLSTEEAKQTMRTLLLIGLITIALVGLLSSAGCAYVPVAVDRAADANDDAVRSAEWVLCKGASVGSIRRAFNDRPDVWADLCRESAAAEFVRGE